eukprot:m.7490 g.7490  ORF g.7490 m.7490 type:complete len:83 (+) comp18786_c0_seq1:933-1181(+)
MVSELCNGSLTTQFSLQTYQITNTSTTFSAITLPCPELFQQHNLDSSLRKCSHISLGATSHSVLLMEENWCQTCQGHKLLLL